MGNVLDTADSRSKMAGKHSKTKTQNISRAKKTGGGTAVGGGVNFQAVATAIVGVHILRGTALNWLEGVCSDKPVAVWAESEGPGDDLRIELENNSKIEIQAKKGLARGRKLWTALHSIAEAIHKGHLSYGVLVVASDSSKTICKDLATDIERLGQGRTDSLTDIGTDWAKQLSKANIPPHEVCRCMRIRVIHALSAEDTNISAAKEVLRYVCARENDVDAAWNSLYRQAVLLIEKRGRWTLQDLVRLLRSTNIAIREDDFPASVLDRHRREQLTLRPLNMIVAAVIDAYERSRVFGHETPITSIDLAVLDIEKLKVHKSELVTKRDLLRVKFAMETGHSRYPDFQHALAMAASISPEHALSWLVLTDKVRLLAEQYELWPVNPFVDNYLGQPTVEQRGDTKLMEMYVQYQKDMVSIEGTLRLRVTEVIEATIFWLELQVI